MGEWVLDTTAAYMTPCDDCAYLGNGAKVVRGRQPAPARQLHGEQYATDRVYYVRARCARDLAP